jgi:hypothetical protein
VRRSLSTVMECFGCRHLMWLAFFFQTFRQDLIDSLLHFVFYRSVTRSSKCFFSGAKIAATILWVYIISWVYPHHLLLVFSGTWTKKSQPSGSRSWPCVRESISTRRGTPTTHSSLVVAVWKSVMALSEREYKQKARNSNNT